MRGTKIGGMLAVGALALMTISSAVSAGGGGRSDACEPDRGDRYGSRSDLVALGVTNDLRLFCFETDDPRDTERIGTIALSGDTGLVGMDYRPANDTLYAVGNAGGLYTIDDRTAAATKVDQLDVALSGTAFGVDVNPAADALRIISDTGQNLRHPFATGTTVSDTALTVGTPPATALGVSGAAYTNNDLDPTTGTTLFDIDATLDQVEIQSPANSGMLVVTGKLGIDTAAPIGFDIYSRLSRGTTSDVKSFASLTVDGRTRLFQVNLLTGRAAQVGSFSSGLQPIDIALPLDQR